MTVPSPTAPPSPPSVLRRIFWNSREIRSGWRLLIFVALSFVLILAANFVARSLHPGDHPFLDPIELFVSDLVGLVPVLLAIFIMARIERRRLTEYGIPALRKAFGGQFWMGNLYGFAAVSMLVGLIALGGGYKILGLAISGKILLKYFAVWLIASAMIGFAEEIIFRSYVLTTLADGIGFWAASFLLSFGFGALHYFTKPHERWEDFACTGLLGLFLCLTLRRTGSLAFAIGFHLAFDFGAIFFYSGMNAGEFAVGHLLNTSWNGPQWITGGLLGPEASRLVFIVIAVLFVVFDRSYRKARFPKSQAAN